MIKKTFRCACCKRIRPRNPRVKSQRYCGERSCQQARKNKWQRDKEEADPLYRANKRECQRAWRNRNKDYWTRYRGQHPEYCERNRKLQHQRDCHKARSNASSTVHLAKPDTLIDHLADTTTIYHLLPASEYLAKPDALTVRITPISTG